MASTTVPEQSTVTLTVPAGSVLATWSTGPYRIDKTLNFPNYPNATANVFIGSGANTTSSFANATVVTIAAGIHRVLYNVGVGSAVIEVPNNQPTVGALNATGTLTIALLLGAIVTSSTAAAVTATLDTGTICDAALTLNVGDCIDWAVINTGGTNAFTVTASTGHTIVGSGVVALTSSARFRTVKTAANTMVTYRLA